MDYEHFGHRTHCGGISSVIVYLILFSTVPFEKEEDWTPKSPIWISYIENRELEKRFNEKKAEFKTQHGRNWESEWAKVTFPFKCACDIPSGNLLDLPTMSDWDKEQIIKGNYINSPNMQA